MLGHILTLPQKRRIRAAGPNGLEKAQAIAAHESSRTTKLYDRTSDALTLEEIEKIAI
jgi:hypothetical protein